MQRLHNSLEATYVCVCVSMSVATTSLCCNREADVNTGYGIVIRVHYQIYYMLKTDCVVLSNICQSYVTYTSENEYIRNPDDVSVRLCSAV